MITVDERASDRNWAMHPKILQIKPTDVGAGVCVSYCRKDSRLIDTVYVCTFSTIVLS